MQLVREEVFTFTPESGEPTVHIRSGQLSALLYTRASDKLADITFPAQELDVIIAAHGIEMPRLASMTEAEATMPIVVCISDDGTHMLVDGAHRRAYWAQRGVNTLRGWIVPYALWSLFTFDPTAPNIVHMWDTGAMLPQRRK